MSFILAIHLVTENRIQVQKTREIHLGHSPGHGKQDTRWNIREVHPGHSPGHGKQDTRLENT